MAIKQSEKNLTKKILKTLNELPKTKAVKREASAVRNGQADITGAYKGTRLEIEVKVGYNKPTKLQEQWLREWKAVGCITGCVWSLSEAMLLLLRYDKQQKRKRFTANF